MRHYLIAAGLMICVAGCAARGTSDSTPGRTWQIIPLSVPQLPENAILLNTQTGETWMYDANGHGPWTKMSRSP